MAGPALHLKPWTEQRLALESESKGRPVGMSAGSHIADLVSLKKTVILCDVCVRKWQSAPNGYVTQSRIPFCSAKCDACREMGTDRKLFLHHSQLPR